MFDDTTQTQNTTAPAMPATDMGAPTGVTPVAAPDPGVANPGFSTPSLPAEPTPAPVMPADATSAPLFSPADGQSTDTTMSSSTDAATSTDSSAVPSVTLSDAAPATTPAPAATTDNSMGSSDLMSIKQDALQNLSPLLGQLDQTPEEKFRTTMMLIQASDDQSLIQTAYAAAKEISDEKVRAQALLDIVNEINYFTQQAKQAA